jgi:putative FmdB family regulatory protein
MPLYEYCCADCHVKFTTLRPIADADAPIACPECGGEQTKRAISLIAASPRGEGETGYSSSSSACSTCSATSCSTCRV